jgi:hypothetical protein
MSKTFTLSKIQFTGDLSDQKVLDNITNTVHAIISIGSGGSSFSLLRELDHLLSANNSDLGENKVQYENLLSELKFS